ncbi:hypothetical protein Pfo_011546 [Paulownia fortunei]|nr:hypothetical protein Pfo_011546 [Paulownia fortunei]
MVEESEKRFEAIMNKLFHSPPKSKPNSNNTSKHGVQTLSGRKRLHSSSVGRKLAGNMLGESGSSLSGSATSAQEPLCRPWDRDDLFRRLSTFKSMTWFAKPQIVFKVCLLLRGAKVAASASESIRSGYHVKLSKSANFFSTSPIISEFGLYLLIHGDGTYAMKKVLIQNSEQLDLVREEIRVSSQFSHPNLLPLLDHAIIAVKASQDQSWKHEAYLLFPVHLDGTLLDNTKAMKAKKEFFSTLDVLQIFRQLCAGLKHMHSFDPPYAHNDVKPGNVLVTYRKGQSPLATLMDFGSARPARKQIRTRSEALQLQEWASEHCSAPFRAPELWDCPSHADIDERTDIWSLGCTLFAIMQFFLLFF